MTFRANAEFIVATTVVIMTMPGLPKVPDAKRHPHQRQGPDRRSVLRFQEPLKTSIKTRCLWSFCHRINAQKTAGLPTGNHADRKTGISNPLWERQPLRSLFSVPATRLPVYAQAAQKPWEASGSVSRSAAPSSAQEGASPLCACAPQRWRAPLPTPPIAPVSLARGSAVPWRRPRWLASLRLRGAAGSAVHGLRHERDRRLAPGARRPGLAMLSSSTLTTASVEAFRRRAAILGARRHSALRADPFLSGGTEPASTGRQASCAKPGRGAIAARALFRADARHTATSFFTRQVFWAHPLTRHTAPARQPLCRKTHA